MRIIYLVALLFQSLVLTAQTENELLLIRTSSAYTAFPDTGRANGHTYNKVLYPAATHYSDSTVLITVPPGFKTGKQVDVVFWFHGWRNSIDSANAYFELTKQFVA